MQNSMKMLMIFGLIGGAVLGCGEAPDEEVLIISTTTDEAEVADDATDENADDVADDTPIDPVDEDVDDAVRTPPQYDGECPSMTEGLHEGFLSGGLSRSFRVELPENPEGAPLVFAWHWLGGNASLVMTVLGLPQLADNEGAIIIAPESDGSAFEWHFTEGPQNNPDLQLFEDLLACAAEQHDVDLDRVYSTGHSAGGLWTSYLTIHASKWLAATAIMSGGANAQSYSTPEHKLPVLVIWGGPNDTYSGFNFGDSSRFLTTELQNDGHFVTTCEHSQGHLPPTGATNYIWTWFEDHPYGAEEPYVDGLPSVFPAYCVVPESPI